MQYMKEDARVPLQYVVSPLIYAMIVPFVLFDAVVEIYHRVCFTAYGIPFVNRAEHFRFDRAKLPYLNAAQKLNCTYCSYGNGLMSYVSAITAATEKYWCSIQHRNAPGFKAPSHHGEFLPYGDEAAYRDFLAKDRAEKERKEKEKDHGGDRA
jgi:hypothetical protein